MTSILLAAILLTSVESANDGSRLVLNFDAPVTYAESVSEDPPGIVIDVPGAATAPGLLPDINAMGNLSVMRTQKPDGLRITVALSEGASGQVLKEAGGSRISVQVKREPPAGSEPVRASLAVAADAAPEGVDEALIGPEDLLEINVFELPELKTQARVMGDGTISLPLLGIVQAAGLTTTGLEARVRELLEERFLLDPQVTITVSEHMSRQVSVIGAVAKPGPYEMIGPRSVLQMLSEAGGLTKEAGTEIFIIRKTGNAEKAERIRLDLEELVNEGDPSLNIMLSPGDVLNVPVDRPIYVFVDGAVRTPGQIEGRSSRPITLLQAVARAGGLTERANLRDVHVLRKDPDGRQTRIPVNLRAIRKGKQDDLILVDGDVVVVPETFF